MCPKACRPIKYQNLLQQTHSVFLKYRNNKGEIQHVTHTFTKKKSHSLMHSLIKYI